MLYGRKFVLRGLKFYTVLLAILGLGCLGALNTLPSWAQSNSPAKARKGPSAAETALRQSANAGTVTVITGGVEGVSNTYHELASDLASVLDVKSELRILPIIGYGSLQNIEDLLYLKGIDFGMVHSDVLRHMEQQQLSRGAKRKLRYVTKLYDEPLHVLANKKITEIQQLNGQTVIVGRPGSGNEMSALTLIADLGLEVNPVHVKFAEGVEKVRSGEAAAMIVVTRKPSSKLRKIDGKSDLHFLPIPMTKAVMETYEPEPLTAKDYPNLIPEGTGVLTPRMSAVLAVYNWQPGSSRYVNVNKFIKSFTDKLDKLGEASRKDIWEKLDVYGEVKGWERYQPAANLVKEMIAARVAASASANAQATASDDPEFALFVEYIRRTTSKEMSESQLKSLYAKYKVWGQQNAAQVQ